MTEINYTESFNISQPWDTASISSLLEKRVLDLNKAIRIARKHIEVLRHIETHGSKEEQHD